MGLADWPLVIGHRGAAGLAPENTLPGFQLAYEMGVSAVELDVRCVSEHLVTIHDDTLERTTNGRGKVSSLDLDGLRKLDAGGGSGIPLLEEVIADLPEGFGLNIELKGEDTAQPTARLLTDFPGLDVLVSSFNHGELALFHQLKPELRVAPLFSRWHRLAWKSVEDLNAWSINLSLRIVDQTIIEEAEKRGLKVLIYTVNNLPEASRLLAMGVTGIFTDRPDVVTRAALTDRFPFPTDTVRR